MPPEGARGHGERAFGKVNRFLVVDNTVWHIGVSLTDIGSAFFAMMKMELYPAIILDLLP